MFPLGKESMKYGFFGPHYTACHTIQFHATDHQLGFTSRVCPGFPNQTLVQGFFGNTTARRSFLSSLQRTTATNHPHHLGVYVIAPQVRLLPCEELGNGALAPIDDIFESVKKLHFEATHINQQSS
jgi:hypothetical protein